MRTGSRGLSKDTGLTQPGARWKRRIVAGALCFVSALAYCVDAPEHPTEAQVKAAYLYNFGKFVRWQAPPQADSFDICVLGKNPFGLALSNTVAGERIDGKRIVASYVPKIAEVSHCRILFISTSEESRVKAILAGAKRANTLTVSDIPQFAEHGGMIGLVNVAGKIRFEVNVAAANHSGIVLSSELLKVAVRVLGMEQEKESGR